ncbi:isocitrate/isopropylmalate family dehydrogenase [Williamsia sp.]|uniref:isocitrate/isopropylmalate dehydrogenase family protein n=1 Tax=Williamsia sp. TaxID=1872085 RepID=UPI001A2FC184|nr:isocitrate/isopropylmalate family dehydrogenase [Williamsia sp.]MBJ7289716.1 isocitrate/isopropylmalate dehydrogenase family protein [Williamsia sp.]
MTTIAVLPGDGIGPEVVDAALPVLEAVGLGWNVEFGEIGWGCWRREGEPVPPATWELIERCDATLMGAITSKPPLEAEAELPSELQGTGRRYSSPVIALRRRLGLFANIRPITDLHGDAFDFVVIRENTEGLYAGYDQRGLDDDLWNLVRDHPGAAESGRADTAVALRLQTRSGLDRIFRCAFDRAAAGGFTRVTLADKPNVLRASGELARERFDAIAAEHPGIEAHTANVDAVAMAMVRSPGSFGVIVAENMFGDILSDLGAGVMGGLGLASSANVGGQGSMFEPVHGSAPDIAGRGVANPFATILTIAQMLGELGAPEESTRIRAAVRAAVQGGVMVTPDLGGTASTADAAAEVIRRLR